MLNMLLSKLYERDTYRNPDIMTSFRKPIYEYDMHHAGYSITKEYHLLPDSSLELITNKATVNGKIDKKKLAIALGLVQRSNEEYKKKLAKGFIQVRKDFFDKNDLEDNDILSIKKDAIFTFKECSSLHYGEVSFAEKHQYTSYLFTGVYEYYYKCPNTLDIKGIGDISFFDPCIIEFIQKFFYKMENESIDSVLKYLRVYIDKYKKLELDVEFYRSFNGLHRYDSKDGAYIYHDIGPEILHEINIRTNYDLLILPLLKAVI